MLIKEFSDLDRNERTPKDATDVNEVNLIAKSVFGTTHSFTLSGYLLTDGTLLNLSENGRKRTLDHRSVKIINGIDMTSFMKLGNVRLSPECGGISLIVEPNVEQYALLMSFIKKYLVQYDAVIVEIFNENLDSKDYFEYESVEWAPSSICEDIEAYFRNGKPLGNKTTDPYGLRNFLGENLGFGRFEVVEKLSESHNRKNNIKKQKKTI